MLSGLTVVKHYRQLVETSILFFFADRISERSWISAPAENSDIVIQNAVNAYHD